MTDEPEAAPEDPAPEKPEPEPEPEKEAEKPEERSSPAEVSAEFVRGRKRSDAGTDLGGSESLDEAAEFRRLSEQGFQRFVPHLSSGNGIVNAGDDNVAVQQQVTVVVNEARQISVLRSTYSRETVRQLTGTYVPTATFAEIVGKLERNFVVVLQGADGSGRRATAVNALAELGMESISVLDAEQSVPLREIAEKKLFGQPGGYVLDHSLVPEDNTLAALGQLARQARSLLVIVAHGDAASCPLTVGAPHPAPTGEQVLHEHIVDLLRGHSCTRCTDRGEARRYASRRLAEIATLDRYALPGKMRELADLARVLAGNLHTGTATSVLVERDRGRLRRIAADAMCASPDKGYDAERRQSFRLAYAVFDGFPLRLVFEAAELLAREVLPLFERRENPPEHVVFEGVVADLLDEQMYVADPVEQRATVEAAPRRARLIDPALTGMILDVVWNDFDSVHQPLLTWLDVLAGHQSPAVRVRAAQAAALLAAFDFDQVYRTLIRPWAERGLLYRQAAAAALQLVAAEGRLAGRVRRQVDDWVRSPHPNLQDSAVRALSTTIGTTDPIGAVEKLRDLAGRTDLAVSTAIGVAMVSLFGTEAATLVLDELTAWATGTNANRRRHAVRAVLLLARAAGPQGAKDWPSVHDVIGSDELRLATVARLWSDALIGPDTAGLAWEPLRRWLVSADDDPARGGFVLDLAGRIFHDVGRSRALFHLSLWHQRYPRSAAIAEIYHTVRKG